MEFIRKFKWELIVMASIVFGGILLATLDAQNGPAGSTWRILPQLLTTTNAVDVCSLTGGPPCNVDVGLCYADASTNGLSSTISIFDHQSTPVYYFNAIAEAANSRYSIINFYGARSCRWFPRGLSVQAGTANAVSMEMAGGY